MVNDQIDRLAAALARIIDDHMVVQVLLARDPQAWADAVNILAEVEGYAADEAENDLNAAFPEQAFRPR